MGEKFAFRQYGTTIAVTLADEYSDASPERDKAMVRIKSSQKLFTEEEVAKLTGICLDHLRSLAQNKHLGTLARAAGAAGAEASQWLFTQSDLSIVTVLQARCEH
jgi:hypothetical protein